MIPWIDLKRQHEAIRPDVEDAIQRVMESGWFVGGPETKAFESEWASYCGVDFCVAVGSGTAALNLTLRALGIGPGDEVVTVAFTLSATLDAIVETGATPVLVDVDPVTYTMDASLLADAITSRTKAILPVHIYGHPADMDAINAVASAHNLPVVADACEAHGAGYKGRPVTELATASCFSFYPTKNFNALGDAGGIVTSDANLREVLTQLRNHGWDRRFHSATTSMNSRMDEIHASVLRSKLRHLKGWNARRAQIAARYQQALMGTKTVAAPAAAWAEPSFYLYVVLTPARDAFRQRLKAAGIATDVHWPEPPHLQPAFENLGYGPGSLPITERLCNEVVTLPMFPELTDAEVACICEALAKA